jgi:hypothetical protein
MHAQCVKGVNIQQVLEDYTNNMNSIDMMLAQDVITVIHGCIM